MAYHFFVADHLGNTRVVANAAGAVEQNYHYYPDGQSIDDWTQIEFDNPYKWSGKEWDGGLGAYDFGARLFAPADSRWTTPDPLAEKYYHISPYAYCAGDPVNRIDPFGLDIYYFNEDGSYSHKVEHDGTHRIAVVSHDEHGNTHTQFYDFADPVNDPADIDNGDITTIQFVDEDSIMEMLSSAGTFDNNLGWSDFVRGSNSLSTSSVSFDYSSYILPNRYTCKVGENGLLSSNYLFLVQGDRTVHNYYNFGNYLWAASGYSMGIPLACLLVGAHANSLGLFGKKGHRQYNGYPPQLDSVDDQFSITCGYIHGMKHHYRKRRK